MCGVARTVGRKLLVLKRLVSKFQFSKRERISRISKILSCLEIEFRKREKSDNVFSFVDYDCH